MNIGFNIVIGWPEGIFLALVFYNIIKYGIYHGTIKDRLYSHYNIGVYLFDTICTLGLLYWGGFFG